MIANPLYELTKKSKKFEWGREQEEAFRAMKAAMKKDVFRTLPDPDVPFVLKTDASLNGMGALLLQEKDGQRFIIECFSKAFNSCQKRYPVIEQEAFAIIYAINRWEHFLSGKKFKLETDHRPLVWLKSKKDCLGKLGRWSLRLSVFDFEIVHIPGSLNKDADALSRATVDSINCEMEGLKQEQADDADLQKVIEKDPTKFQKRNEIWFQKDNGHLRVCIPHKHRLELWRQCHDDLGHGGPMQVLDLMKKRFYWPRMKQIMKQWARFCKVCAMSKDFLPQPAPAPLEVVNYTTLEPFEKVAIDVMGPFPTSKDGCKYVMVLVDGFTKWAEAKATAAVKAEDLVTWLRDDVFTRHGIPKEIVLDRGANMEAEVLKSFCHSMGINLTYTTAYHHQSNPVERLHRTLINKLRCYVSENQTDWSSHLPLVLFSYRIAKHESIKISPFEAITGRQPRLPMDLKYQTEMEPAKGMQELISRMMNTRTDMRQALGKASVRAKKQYDERCKVVKRQFKIGDLVYARRNYAARGTSKKLASPWMGPFQLVQQGSPVTWLVQGDGTTTRMVHVNNMKTCLQPKGSPLEVIRGRGRPPKS